jgi:hypothetical protein
VGADDDDDQENECSLDVPSARRHNASRGASTLADGQIQAKTTIAAALIQSRAIDAEALGSQNKDISNLNLAHLRELTERIYAALVGGYLEGCRMPCPDADDSIRQTRVVCAPIASVVDG